MIRIATSLVFAFLLVVAWTDAARAKSFTVNNVLIFNPDNSGGTLESNELNEVFNRARCLCGDEALITVKFELSVDQAGESKPFAVVAGAGTCLKDENDLDEQKCTKLDVDAAEMNNVVGTEIEKDLPANQLMSDVGCIEEVARTIKLRIFAEVEDEWSVLADEEKYPSYSADIKPPSPPTRSKDPSAGETTATVHFTPAENTETDSKFFQVLCVKMPKDENDEIKEPWGGTPPDSARFMTSEVECGVADDPPADDADTSGDPEPPADLMGTETGGRANPYVCSERGTDSSVTIKNLVNGTEYGFYVVAIDTVENPSEPRWLGTATPVPAEDLWQRYKRLGGEGEGGYGCAIGDLSFPGAAGLLSLLSVLVWYARRRRRAPAAKPKGTRP